MKIQESAVIKLRELRSEENNPDLKFRVFVQGGGCSGMQYGFTFDEAQNEDDFDFKFDGTLEIREQIELKKKEQKDFRSGRCVHGASNPIVQPGAKPGQT
jgi:iron-sulfur cluster insertion protein